MIDLNNLANVLQGVSLPAALGVLYLMWRMDRRLLRIETHLFGPRQKEGVGDD